MPLIIALVVVVVIAGFLALAATKPNSFRIERSAVIEAPPTKVFGYLNDFHEWSQWSPWEKIDPDMKRAFGGAEFGKGAVYTWDGNSKAGSGRMEILESAPGASLLIQLDFLKPMQARNTTEFTLTPTDDGTRVSWAIFGASPYVSKIMTSFFNMEKMVGGDFDKGLASLKMVAES